MLKAVIFDLDGVICSTDEYHYEAWKAMADNIGVPFDKAVNNRLRGVSRMDSLDIILEQYPGQLSAAEKEALAEQLHIDVLPAILEQPRRYAFRYLQLEVLDASCKYCLRLEDAFCTAVTSAEDAAREPQDRKSWIRSPAIPCGNVCRRFLRTAQSETDGCGWGTFGCSHWQTTRLSKITIWSSAASTSLRGRPCRKEKSVPAYFLRKLAR